MKMALGTVQFGLDYGAFKKSSFCRKDLKNILSLSYDHQVDLLDTAYSYGESERLLGENCNDKYFRFVTKMPKVVSASQVEDYFLESLKRLKTNKVYGLLFHDPNQLVSENADLFWQSLLKLKQAGLVDKIGVSVYNPAETFLIINSFDIDIIQLPYSVADQRFMKSGCLQILKKKKVEVHARSIFLQGLLINENIKYSFFDPIKDYLSVFDFACKEKNINKIEGCIGFVNQNEYVDKFVVGIDSINQFQDLIRTVEKVQNNTDRSAYKFQSWLGDEKYIDPSKWILK